MQADIGKEPQVRSLLTLGINAGTMFQFARFTGACSQTRLRSMVMTLIASMLLLTAQVSLAEVNAFLDIDGAPGESVNQLHADEIDVLAWNWGTSSIAAANKGGRRAGKVCGRDIEIIKRVDAASAPLLMAQVLGTTFSEATLSVQSTQGEQPVDFMTLTFRNLMITSMSTGSQDGDDQLTERVTFAFESAEFAYTEYGSDGSVSGEHSADFVNTPGC